MMRSKASKDSSRGFQTNSEITFLINARKTLPTSGQTVDVIFKLKISLTKHPLTGVIKGDSGSVLALSPYVSVADVST